MASSLDAFVTAFNLRGTHWCLGLNFKELMYGRIKNDDCPKSGVGSHVSVDVLGFQSLISSDILPPGCPRRRMFSLLPTCGTITRMIGIESPGWNLLTDGAQSAKLPTATFLRLLLAALLNMHTRSGIHLIASVFFCWEYPVPCLQPQKLRLNSVLYGLFKSRQVPCIANVWERGNAPLANSHSHFSLFFSSRCLDFLSKKKLSLLLYRSQLSWVNHGQ